MSSQRRWIERELRCRRLSRIGRDAEAKRREPCMEVFRLDEVGQRKSDDLHWALTAPEVQHHEGKCLTGHISAQSPAG